MADSQCLTINFANTLSEYVQLEQIWLAKLRLPRLFQKDSNYKYVFDVLQKYSRKVSNVNQPVSKLDAHTHHVMLQLSKMLETSLILSDQVRNQFLQETISWFHRQKITASQPQPEDNAPVLITTVSQLQSTSKKNIRPQSSITPVHSRTNFSRPVTAAYRRSMEKQRPDSSKQTLASTKDCPNSQFYRKSQFIEELKKETLESQPNAAQQQQIFINYDKLSEQSEQNIEIPAQEIDYKHKVFTKTGQQVFEEANCRKINQYCENNNLLGNQGQCFQQLDKVHQKHNTEAIKEKAQTDQIQRYLNDYRKLKARVSKESSRRIQSAKLRPQSCKREPILSTANQQDNLSNKFEFKSPCRPNVVNIGEHFMKSRYYSSTNLLKKHKNDYKPVEYLTRAAVQSKPCNFQFQPLSLQHIKNYNQENIEEIIRIKKSLKKHSHISTKALMNALVYNEEQYRLNQNIAYPYSGMLLNNPFLKKKKKKTLKKKTALK